MRAPRAPRVVAASAEARVTPIELFFDLVFVFGLTQITALMAHDVSVHGIVRGLLVLALLWWSWVAYAWLCNVVVADEGAIRAALFAVMAAMFLLALAIPQAFTALPGGGNGPLVVALCYFAFRALHLVAIGVGMAGLPITWSVVAASVLGLTVCATLWWAYFDITALLGERALVAESDATRSRLARDAYTFLHLPMVAGIVLLALGLKKVLQHVTDGGHDEPLALAALYGGVALYLLAHVGFKMRVLHTLTVHRVVVAVALLALLPLTGMLTPLAALTLLAGVLVMLIGYEMIRFATARESVRHSRAAPA